MKFLDRLERFVSKFAVKDLMKYIMLGSLFVYIGDMVSQGSMTKLLYFDSSKILQGQVWRVLTFIFVPSNAGIFAIITMFFYYYIGRVLEMAWGTARFNTYYLLGVIFTLIGGFTLGYTTTIYLNMTLFLAYAATFPDSMVNIYFILPVKVKYLGFVSGAFILYDLVTSENMMRVIILISLANFFLFFGPSFLKDNKRRSKTQKMRRNIESAKINTKIMSIHKCTTCGMTEKDDPDMEFRFCSSCEGNYEYCTKHIRTHEHKKKVINMDERRQS